MSQKRLLRARLLHQLKMVPLLVLPAVVIMLLQPFLPGWCLIVLFFLYGFLVLIPAAMGMGPIGRIAGREMNEAAIEKDRAYRATLGPLTAVDLAKREADARADAVSKRS